MTEKEVTTITVQLNRVIKDLEGMCTDQKEFQEKMNDIILQYTKQTEKTREIESLSKTNASDIKRAFIWLLIASLGLVWELLYIIFGMINGK